MVFPFPNSLFRALRAVGYIVVERGRKVENYVVIEGKDGSVRAVKVDKNPSQFMKKDRKGEDKK